MAINTFLKLAICGAVLLLAISDATLASKDEMMLQVPNKELKARNIIQQLFVQVALPQKLQGLEANSEDGFKPTGKVGDCLAIDCPPGFICILDQCI
ncbi:hypothetical protein BVRB_6g154370 [Beta vulgaris subsp. vulgaris]|nr:hypothetical protein BVRB_6g154370 [Beta vulgaris subsp. vulgaris]